MVKSKKQMYIIIGVFTLVMMLGTVTYAFFNYTRTGNSNNIRVGRISFVSKNEETITLSNIFPIDPSESGIMEDTTKVGTYSIEIKGDTDYVDGIEYLVSVVDSNITTGSKIVPISLNISATNLGTPSADYFTEREEKNATIYKQLVGDTLPGDGQILVGYIKPNTTSGTAEGVDGSITIKAYLDTNKIKISDTYDGTESDNMGTTNEWANGKTVLTTNEWNALQQNGLSFKVKVEANEGIWVEETRTTLYGIMHENAVMDNVSSEFVTASTGINFGAVSSDTNGKGVYMRAGTENDSYPIVYYRGDVDNNNVLFNNMCWNAVRTTDTGGVKLIYSGEVKQITTYEHSDILTDSEIDYTNDSTYPYDYDSTTNTWTSTNHTDGDTGTFIFTVKEAGNYMIRYDVSSEESIDVVLFYKNDTLLEEDSGEKTNLALYLGELSTTDEIKVEYTKDSMDSDGDDNVVFSIETYYGDSIQTLSCNNDDDEKVISEGFQDDYSNEKYLTAAGYMYGDNYTPYNSETTTAGTYYGSGFIYNNDVYTLTNPSTTKDANHHYTCNSTVSNDSCGTIRYYYYDNYYINLTGGDGVEEAIAKMQTNTNDSDAKYNIDTWYASNMTGVTNKLEDTIWCNDRSFGDGNNNGWIANGGDLSTPLYYGARQRSNSASNTSTVKNQPSLACPNKNDAFTVSNENGNQKLTYPVALLTEDEMVLAGGLAGISSTFYLNDSNYYWSLSPGKFGTTEATQFFVGYGYVQDYDAKLEYFLRPSISLKHRTPVVSGTGTVNDPYVIE